MIVNPARRNRSTVACSSEPLQNCFSFTVPRTPSICGVRVVGLLLVHRPAVTVELAEETAFVAFVTDAGPEGLDSHQDRIDIAVRKNFFDDQAVARMSRPSSTACCASGL